MDKQELKRRIIANYGEMVNVTQTAQFIGCTRQTARVILRGVPYLDTGKAKKYTADDVAGAIMRGVINDEYQRNA